ncbi:MAG: 4Fe-4S binding protein [Actinobacteria bacterium]|nr:4Fe-4S binding protein [Actinomycetota bacterium]
MLAHIDSRGLRLHARIPFPLNVIGSKYEYVLMKVLGYMTDADWIYRFRIGSYLVDKLANRVVLPLIHGEVITPDELEYMLYRLEREGHTMALGICECRHGENNLTKEMVDGQDPNYTCVMIGDWGKGHLSVYPELYRSVTADELVETARFWHERGRILTGWGLGTAHGFLASYCHCKPEYCVPLRNQIKRGNKVFSRGYSYAVVDPELCMGPDKCSFDCSSRCYFDAIVERDGKAHVDPELCYGCGQCFLYCPSGAVQAQRREHSDIVFCAPDLLGYE